MEVIWSSRSSSPDDRHPSEAETQTLAMAGNGPNRRLAQMTIDELIQEGRRLARPCVLLKDDGAGPTAGAWYEQERDAVREEVEATDELLWLVVDSRFVPSLTLSPEVGRYLCVYTNEQDCTSGRVTCADAIPLTKDRRRRLIELRAFQFAPLPPIDAIFSEGSPAISEWLHANRWSRNERYNDNFAERALVAKYEQLWRKEYPLFSDDVYAVLGGWHLP
jgi:hypothetical protein